MADPVLVAKAAATLLTNEKARKGVGWVVAAILSPIIVLVALLCSLGSGAADHNISAAQLCFQTGPIPADGPAEYRICVEQMLLPDAADETASDRTSVIQIPEELMRQASIPQDADLQITCLDGCIVISRDTGLQPEELYPMLKNLQVAEALASMLPEEAPQALAKLEQTIGSIQKGAEQDG